VGLQTVSSTWSVSSLPSLRMAGRGLEMQLDAVPPLSIPWYNRESMPPIPFGELGVGSEIVRGELTFYFGESMRDGLSDNETEKRSAQSTTTVIDSFPACVQNPVEESRDAAPRLWRIHRNVQVRQGQNPVREGAIRVAHAHVPIKYFNKPKGVTLGNLQPVGKSSAVL